MVISFIGGGMSELFYIWIFVNMLTLTSAIGLYCFRSVKSHIVKIVKFTCTCVQIQIYHVVKCASRWKCFIRIVYESATIMNRTWQSTNCFHLGLFLHFVFFIMWNRFSDITCIIFLCIDCSINITWFLLLNSM